MSHKIIVEIDAYLRDCPPWDEPIDEARIPGIADEIARRFDSTEIYSQIDDLACYILRAPANAGPTYDVWIAEPDNWVWQTCGMTFTCSDDPDGDGARQRAHDHARHLRNTYPCAFVAVRAATKGLPLPVRLPLP